MYYGFKNPANALSAVYHLKKDHQFLPSVMHKAPDGTWMIPLVDLPYLEKISDPSERSKEFNELVVQYKWAAHEVPGQPKDLTQVDIKVFVTEKEIYKYSSSSHGKSKGAKNVSGAQNKLINYILGAENQVQAQRILQSLNNLLVREIEAYPLMLDSNGAAPFQFFWSVKSKHPLPFAFDIARRVWWEYGEPVEGKKIYVQWPYSPVISMEIFQSINWGPDGAFILMGPDSPNIVQLGLIGKSMDFRPLIEVAEPQTLSRSEVKIQTSSPAGSKSTQLALKVNLRLVSEAHIPENRLYNRIDGLKKEIEAKQKRIEYLEQLQQETRRSSRQVYCPLYLYRDKEDGNLPNELKRLLIEWSDQAEALCGLRHLKMRSPLQPDDIDIQSKPPWMHVLTPSRDGPADLGVRLREYRPSGEFAQFELLAEWAVWDLYLFIPVGQCLTLYPDLKPGATAADKLGRALLQNQRAGPRKDWIILLYPGKDGKIRPVPIQRSDFHSLSEFFEWKCALDLSLPEDDSKTTSKTTSKNVSDVIINGVEKNFQTEVENKIKELIQDLEKQLVERKNEFETFAREQREKLEADIKSRKSHLDKITGLRKDIDRDLLACSDHLLDLIDAVEKLAQLPAQINDTEAQLLEIRNILDRLKQSQSNLSDAKAENTGLSAIISADLHDKAATPPPSSANRQGCLPRFLAKIWRRGK